MKAATSRFTLLPKVWRTRQRKSEESWLAIHSDALQ